jgi:alpha/beta superfamily hydrolase
MGTSLPLGSRSVAGRRIVARARIATEAGLAGLAAGLLALHVADDNFLQPQTGTEAADHLLSGLVPIALLIVFAARYARLRAGTRATIAVAAGLFGIAAGMGEAGYYTLEYGPSGDDYTGLLAIPAGLLLASVGAATLWRTRRLSDRLAWRYARRVLLAVGAVAGVYFVLAPLALTYIFTHSARAQVPVASLGAAYEKVSFKTDDGLTLRGWYVPSKNRASVISAPGRADSQGPARMLVRHGYGVLLFDRRGEGESDGDPHIFGWGADDDLNAAVAFLQRRADVDPNRIGGIGLSVGGETLLQAAAESDGLKAVVSDGAGSRSIREDLARPGTSKWEEVPTSLVMTVGNMLFSNHAPPPELGSIVSRISPRAVFFIYGEHDQANVQDLTPRYYANAGRPKALWRVPGASHTGGIDAHPRDYERRLIAFLDNALLDKGTE